MGWQIPDMFQSITDKFLSTSFSLTGLELSETGACREHRGSASCRCLLLLPLPLLLSVTESSAPQFNSARQASCKNHLRPPWTTWINMKGRSNRRVTSKYHLSSHVTTSSVPRPSNLYKTLLWKVPSEPFQNSAQHKKKMKNKMYAYTYMQGRARPSVSLIILSTIKSSTSGPSPSTRGCYCLLCPDESNSIKFTPSTNHSGT